MRDLPGIRSGGILTHEVFREQARQISAETMQIQRSGGQHMARVATASSGTRSKRPKNTHSSRRRGDRQPHRGSGHEHAATSSNGAGTVEVVPAPIPGVRQLNSKGEIPRSVSVQRKYRSTVTCFFCLTPIAETVFWAPVPSPTGGTAIAALCEFHTPASWRKRCVVKTCKHCRRPFGYRPTKRQRRFCAHVCRVMARQRELRLAKLIRVNGIPAGARLRG
jgi:hypothetical protein